MKMKHWYLLLCSIGILAQKPTVGLVLSGGGAKGFAHVAVLKQLEESHVTISYIGGTSMGAIIAGLYASGYSADELEALIKKTDINSLLFKPKDKKNLPLFDKTYNDKYLLEVPFDNFKITIPSAISSGENAYLYLSQLFNPVHEIADFSKLHIPFYCVATELESGKEKILSSGYLPECVLASAAMPSLLNPVEINGKKYIDGGVVNNFPAKHMKELGMDIVIGVNLGQGLKKEEELEGIQDIMNQVTNYSIISGVEKQLPYVDILLNPKLKNISVVDFKEKDSILLRGKQEAERFKSVFDSIGKLQNLPLKVSNVIPNNYCIKKINIRGNRKFTSDYIKGRLGFKDYEDVTSEQITKGLNNLYTSNNYEFVDYRIVSVNDGNNLNLNLIESRNRLIAKLGLHYDDVFKTGFLLNLSLKNFIFNNTSASLDVILGDKPRYYFNVFADNGIKPSIGFHSSFINTPFNYYTDDNLINYINYNFNWNFNSLYVQSTFSDKYAVGLSLDHDYTKIKSSTLSTLNPNRILVNSYYLGPKVYLNVNTLDNPNFPKEGIKLYGFAKYLWLSNQPGFNKSLHFNGDFQFNVPISHVFTFKQSISFGTSVDNNSVVYNNKLGGILEQNLLLYEPFVGYQFSQLEDENKIKLSSVLQIGIFKNNYISLIGNIANLERELKDIHFFKYKYTGIGIDYGYDSPLGPIHLNYSYSPQIKKNILYFTLGYWF